MKLFVTGGAGFIGSQFIRGWLFRHSGDEVVNLDRLTYAGSRQRLQELDDRGRYRLIESDICDAQVVERALAGCEAVIHFAAETHVDRSITNAAPFLRTNVEGTLILLQAARRVGIKRFVHVSTDEVYGPILQGEVDESAPLAPRSPYAASKAAGDLLAQSFYHTYQLPVIIARPTNIYGPAQLPEKFIPLCIVSAFQGCAIPIYGDGQQRRGWLFVEDACEALECLLQRGTPGSIYNVGSGHEQTNRDTACQILSLMGRPEGLLQPVEDRPGHDRRYAMRDDKLHALGWKPRTPFGQGLAATVGWYRAHTSWWQPLVQQLREDPYHWLNRTPGSSARPSADAIA